MKRSLSSFLVCMAVLFELNTPFCPAQLKPDELFALMRASRSRYISIEAAMEVKGYRSTDQKQENPPLMYSQDTIYRRAGGLVYAECITKTFSETGKQNQYFKEIAILSPQGKKYYRQEPLGNKHGYGHIQKERELSGWMSMTPDIIFWWNLEWPGLENQYSSFLRQHADKVSITLDQTNRFYVLDTPVGIEENAPHFRYTVDPSRGYMPTVQEWLADDKTLVEKYVCSDYRLVNGLWAPFGYSIYLPNGTKGTDVTIKSLSINQPVAPEKFTFEFPAGTHVIDRILGVSYTVGDKKTNPNQQFTADTSIAIPVQTAPPATDEELAEIALKAKEMLVREKQAGAQVIPVVVPVEIIPSYVWVLPGKNDYIFSIKSESDKKPTLLSHSVEGGGLIFHLLENQISETGEFKVTLQRPDELTGFAEGVMTLTFSDQTATVHYIAAPIQP